MTNIYDYIFITLSQNNVENPELGAKMITATNNIFWIELALRKCELELFKQNESLNLNILKNTSLPSFGEGWNIEIIEDYQVEITFYFGKNYPDSDICIVPLIIYKALLQDFYFSIKESNFHTNGQIKSIGHSDSYIRSGVWTTYYDNGQIESQGEYLNSQKNGTWSYFFENGQVKAIEHYNLNGKRTGKWETWHPNGQIESQNSLFENEYIGDFKRWYPSGQLSYFSQYDEPIKYKDGTYSSVRKDGEHVSWYDNGNIKTVYVSNNNRRVEVREYSEKGILIRQNFG